MTAARGRTYYRVHALESTIADHYGIDLPSCWPRLWLVLPDLARNEVSAAEEEFAASCVQATWAFPYLAVGIGTWWPACLIAAVIAASAWRKGRNSIASLATLAESTIDLYGQTLAAQLGLQAPAGQRLTPETGRELTRIARKNR